MCCSRGHLSCKECIFENILAQKKETQRQQRQQERRRALVAEEMRQREAAVRQAEIERFERSQTSVVDLTVGDAALGTAETKVIDGK
ncbi:hypothetical protein HK405_000935, partial [Cladochytrium tenue]